MKKRKNTEKVNMINIDTVREMNGVQLIVDPET